MKFKIDKSLYDFKNRFVTLADTTNIHYVDEGNGSITLLMLHGNPTWSFLYRNMIRELQNDFRCIVPDLSGFGLSEASQNFDFKADSHYRVLSEFVEAIGLENYIVIGQDWGGMLGLKLAQQYPINIRGLILGNTWGWPLKGEKRFEIFSWINGGPMGRSMAKEFNGVWRVFMKIGFHKKLSPQVRKMYEAPFLNPKNRIQTAIFPRELIHAYDFEKSVAKGHKVIAHLPTLFLWGKYDKAFKLNCLDKFQKLFKNNKTVLLEASHFWQEDQPIQASNEIKQWVKSTDFTSQKKHSITIK